ncbi:AsmA family protein [Pelagibaculum spongiae]|uniref:AsmA domain-containing protein n=1 Tax=Pelagibaculum spongiae TaxID=2080658 RepID=A0A2V1GR81_9GAMM|nr:AsmA family protein [Pelagibaculum spongiae]PVZ63520.1 hypothetical protein DC094_20770 [Pelagibaculum spongiae]
MLRKTLLTLFSLIALTLLAGIIALSMLDLNQHKQTIADQVLKATGLQLDIQGNIRPNFLPSLGLQIEKLQISDPKHPSTVDMGTLDKLLLKVAIGPLFSGQLQVEQLTIEGAKLNFYPQPDGQLNWHIHATPTQESSTAEQPTVASSTDDISNDSNNANDWSQQWLLQQFQMRNIEINWYEAMDQPIALALKIPELAAEQVSLQQPFEVVAFIEATTPDLKLSLNQSWKMDLAQQNIQSTNLNGQLDFQAAPDSPSKFSGTIQLKGFDQPNLQLSLTMDQLLLANSPTDSRSQKEQLEAVSQKSSTPSIEQPSADTEKATPIQLPKLPIQLTGHVELGKLIANGITVDNLSLDFSHQNDIWKIAPFSADFYQGQLLLTSKINNQQQPLQLALDAQLKQVAIGALLKDLQASSTEKTNNTQQKNSLENRFHLNGEIDLSAKINAKGTTDQALLASAIGNAALSMEQGILNGIDLQYQLCKGIAAVRKKPLDVQNSQQTDFKQLQLQLALADGQAHTQQMQFGIPGVELSGKGGFDLLQPMINLQLQAQLNRSSDAACDPGSNLSKIPLPITVSGKPDALAVALDQKTLNKALGNLALEKAKNKLSKEIGRWFKKH